MTMRWQAPGARPRILPAMVPRARSSAPVRRMRSTAASAHAGTSARSGSRRRSRRVQVPCSARSRRTCRRRRSHGRLPARCTRIWCVRPVLSETSSRLKPGRRRATLTSVIERRPSAWSASTARTRRSPAPSRYLCSGWSMTLVGWPATPRPPGPSRSSPSAARCCAGGTAPAAPAAPNASWRSAAGPEVSLSSRCTSSRKRASGRAWRSCSMTPKLTPLPPCTATPAGLSMAIRCSSS